MTKPFTTDEVEYLKTLTTRVRNALPKIDIFNECVVTGPAVAELAVKNLLSQRDRTFIIFARNGNARINVYDRLKDRGYLPLSNAEVLGRGLSRNLNWFITDTVDLTNDPPFLYVLANVRMIIHYVPFEEWVDSFDAHPIYCYEGKSYVNRMRLDEAMVYVNSPDKRNKTGDRIVQ
jgi:hypothetical protein